VREQIGVLLGDPDPPRLETFEPPQPFVFHTTWPADPPRTRSSPASVTPPTSSNDARQLGLRPVDDLSRPVTQADTPSLRLGLQSSDKYVILPTDGFAVGFAISIATVNGKERTVMGQSASRCLGGGWHRREPVSIVSRRTVAGVPTAAVRAMSRPRHCHTILEPESGLVRANFEAPGQRESLLNVR
jgi:hypothetical protein